MLKGLKSEIDSAKAIGSLEIGVTCEEPNVLELDEYTEELLHVFDSISGIRLDPKLLRVSRQVVGWACTVSDRECGQRTGAFQLSRRSGWT